MKKPAEANSKIILPRLTGLSLRDDLRLHEDVLRHIATFLDFQTLRPFRLVSREWNAAGMSMLMKRGYVDLSQLCQGNEERSDLHKVVSLEPNFRPPYLLNPTKISYPELPRLRVLKLGLYACQSISVPELGDSAHNLHVLEMKGNKEVSGSRKDSNYYCRGSDKESYSNPKHTQLRSFSTDKPFNGLPTLPFQGLSTLEMVSSKFPNLVELRLGTV
jgi:hypothetical protein